MGQTPSPTAEEETQKKEEKNTSDFLKSLFCTKSSKTVGHLRTKAGTSPATGSNRCLDPAEIDLHLVLRPRLNPIPWGRFVSLYGILM